MSPVLLLNDGTMKGLAFAKDPDGYWVEAGEPSIYHANFVHLFLPQFFPAILKNSPLCK